MCPLETYSYNDQQHLVLDRDSASFPLMIMNSAMSALNTLQLYSRLQSLSKRLPTTWLIIHIIHAFLVPGITRVQNIAAFNTTWLVEAWLVGIQSILITKVTFLREPELKVFCPMTWSFFTSVSICQQKIIKLIKYSLKRHFERNSNPQVEYNAICNNLFNTKSK